MKKTIAVILLISVSIFATTAAAPKNGVAIDKLLTAKKKETFTFGILGDTQLTNEKLKAEIIRDLLNLNVDFIIQVGDMIKGYTNDTTELVSQWEMHDATLTILGNTPILLVPGNHDISPAYPATLDLFKKRYGTPYYSFNYQGQLFIVLNTDMPEQEGITDDQLLWLKSLLAKTAPSDRIFLFMHRPLMKAETVELHTLFKKHGVDYVFYGHEHNYEYERRDGVTYIQTVASAKTPGRSEKAGDFAHSLFVTVTPDTTFVSIIRPNSVMRPDTVMSEFSDQISDEANRKNFTMQPLMVDKNRAGSYTIEFSVSNNMLRPLPISYSWNDSLMAYSISPRMGDTAIQPNSMLTMKFQLKVTPSNTRLFKEPELKLTYKNPNGKGDTVPVEINASVYLKLDPKRYNLSKELAVPVYYIGDTASQPIISTLTDLGLKKSALNLFHLPDNFKSVMRSDKKGVLVITGRSLDNSLHGEWFAKNAGELKEWVASGGRIIASLPARRNLAPLSIVGLVCKPYAKNEGDSVHLFGLTDRGAALFPAIGKERLDTKNVYDYLNLGYYDTLSIGNGEIIARDVEKRAIAVYYSIGKGKILVTTANIADKKLLETMSDAARIWYEFIKVIAK